MLDSLPKVTQYLVELVLGTRPSLASLFLSIQGSHWAHGIGGCARQRAS